MIPVREQIIQAIVARVQPLTTFPIQRVVRTQTETNEKVISVWDGPEESLDDQRYQNQSIEMVIVIEIMFDAADPSPDINQQIALIIQAMMSTDTSLGGLARSMRYDSSLPQYRDEGSKYSGVQCQFSIRYAYPIGDPFTVAT